MTKHTPGPWIAVGGWVEHPEDSVADICVCDPISMGQNKLSRPADEIYANARLIAAAPEMLEALCNFVAWFNKTYPEPSTHPEHEWIIANRVISKAMGEDPC